MRIGHTALDGIVWSNNLDTTRQADAIDLHTFVRRVSKDAAWDGRVHAECLIDETVQVWKVLQGLDFEAVVVSDVVRVKFGSKLLDERGIFCEMVETVDQRCRSGITTSNDQEA